MHKRARELVSEDQDVKARDRELSDKRRRLGTQFKELRRDAIERTRALAAAGRIDASVVALALMAEYRDCEVYAGHDGSLVLCMDVSSFFYECGGSVSFGPDGKVRSDGVHWIGAVDSAVDLLDRALWTVGMERNAPASTVKYTQHEALMHLCECLDRAEDASRARVAGELASVLPVAFLPELVCAYVGPVSHAFNKT